MAYSATFNFNPTSGTARTRCLLRARFPIGRTYTYADTDSNAYCDTESYSYASANSHAADYSDPERSSDSAASPNAAELVIPSRELITSDWKSLHERCSRLAVSRRSGQP